MLLQLTDGTTTLTLSGGDNDAYHGVTYFPQALSLSETLQSGATVTETVELIIRGDLLEDRTTAVVDIERLLMGARRRQLVPDAPRVFAKFQAHDRATIGRCEVLDGDVAFDENPQARKLAKDAQRVWITWQRKPYWEGNLTQLVVDQTLTNMDGSNSLYTVRPVAGVLPAPCMVSLANDSGSSQNLSNVFLGVNAFNDPENFDGTFGAKALTWTAPRTFETGYAATWTPTAAQFAAIGSNYWRFVLAFTGGMTADVSYRMQWNFGTVNVIAKTDEYYADYGYYLADLGAMAIPDAGQAAVGGMTLELAMASATVDDSDALTLVQMFPAENFRWLDPIGSLADGETLVDDGIEGYAYVEDGSVRYPQIRAHGKPLVVHPGYTHRFSLLFATSLYSSMSQVMNVWYRPRYLTVLGGGVL